MEAAYWEQLVAEGHRVPTDRPLAELTTELTAMLGESNPYVRDHLAYATLATWIADGVYDRLLDGLGDGMAAGLVVGLGTTSSDTVFRRSCSARVLEQCLRRDNQLRLMPLDTILRWGDQLTSWLVRERDLRGYVETKGWALTVGYGADALGELARSAAVGRLELTVLLDVIADRLTAPTDFRLTHGEDDRLASATMAILRRNLLALDVLEPWLARLVDAATTPREGDPFWVNGNIQGFLRALHLQLALSASPPACRTDLLLTLIEGLKHANPQLGGH